jgi:NodT family efflux transporter outer membrane factor (OMF) lipoprotein
MRSALLFTILALYGCASSPGYKSAEVPLPASYRALSDSSKPVPYVAPDSTTAKSTTHAPAGVSADFWRRLGDTTLTRLIDEVLRSNLDVEAARARVNAAGADHLRAKLDLTPSATIAGGYTRQRYAAASFPGVSGVLPDQNVWEAGVAASWDLDVFGRLRRSVQAQGALVGVAEENLRDAQVSFTAELARAYFELRGAQEQLEVARNSAENQERTVALTRERLAAGRGSAFDTERAQAQLASTLAIIPTREAQVAAAQYRIGTLVGRSPSEVAHELEQPGQLPLLPDVTMIDSPESVVRFRPDVASAERYAAAQGAFVGAAKASYLPRLSIGGTAGYSAPQFNGLGTIDMGRYSIGPVVSWPILDLGRVKADVNAAQAREDDARARYRQSVLAAMEDLETTLVRYRTAREGLKLLEDASAASERAAQLARLRFREGVTDLLQVLDAERTSLFAQDRLVQGRVDAATAYAALYRAVGGR